MKHLNDYNAMYLNGAQTISSVLGTGDGIMNIGYNTKYHERYKTGYSYGTNNAERIFKNNKNQTIKIITHSMGAAYGKGFTQALVEYCIRNGIDLSTIEFEADFAPVQPKKQKAVEGVKTFQYSNDHDAIANNSFLGSPKGDIEGATIDHNSNPKLGHTITDFAKR